MDYSSSISHHLTVALLVAAAATAAAVENSTSSVNTTTDWTPYDMGGFTLSPDNSTNTTTDWTPYDRGGFTLSPDNSTTAYNVTMDPDEQIETNITKEAAEEYNNVTVNFLQELLSNMNIYARPISDEDGGAVAVLVDFHLLSFSSISEVNMDYKIDIYFRQTWYDKRLTFNVTEAGKDHWTLANTASPQIWVPDVFFPNEKKGEFHSVTTSNKMIRIYPDGKVKYSIRLTLTMSCLMHLSAFPMDSQVCPFKIESYSYVTSELTLFWATDPVVMEDNLELPQFSLETPVQTSDCTNEYRTGTFPCLLARFHMRRHIGFYLLQTYIPTALIIVLSWVSFWINMEAVPARISLSVTTVMTMVTQLAGSKASIPRVSYPKAVDIWMTMGLIFVFAALIEYAFVNSLDRRHQRQKQKAAARRDSKAGLSPFDRSDSEDDVDDTVDYKGRARMIDKVARYAFPLSFVIFNVLYWPIYLTLDKK